MKHLLKLFLAAAMLAAAAAAPRAAEKTGHPVVVELFTSQGCSSCPPAEAFLADLAKRKDVIALEYHVNYWDYIGWKDPFARAEYTARQRGYVQALGGSSLYTPQMVIAGRDHAVGSRRESVNSKIAAYRPALGEPALTLAPAAGNKLRIQIGAGEAPGAHDILLVTYDKPHRTEVRRGENEGRVLVNANVVRSIRKVGEWNGEPVDTVVSAGPKSGNGGCAVLVQRSGFGPIVAAAAQPF
jgi:hypothetical protein